MLIPAYPAIPAANTRLREPMFAPRPTMRYAPYATSEPTMAILKQFAPIAVIPPSPKNTA